MNQIRFFKGCNNSVLLLFLGIAAFIAIIITPLQPISAQDVEQDTNEETFVLNLKNTDIRALIETVSKRTGRNFIVDPRVKATVNVISSEPVNADKLYQLFQSVLQIHGFAAVQAGSFTKIVPTSVGVQSAVPVLDNTLSGGGLSTDELVSQVLHLENIPAQQVVEAVRPLLPQTARISAESNSNTVIVTDRAANIAKLIELIIRLDARQ